MKRFVTAVAGLGLLALVLWFFSYDPNAHRAPRATVAVGDGSGGVAAPEDLPHPGRAASSPAAQGVTPEAPAEWPEDAPRTLAGTVRDPQGRPIAGAVIRVSLHRAPDKVARTGVAGTYRLDRIPAFPDRIAITAGGYEPFITDGPRLPRQARVRWDAELDPLDGVFGVVLGGGWPVPEAFVSLRVAGQERRLESGRTDEGGRFSLGWPDRSGPFVVAAYSSVHGRAEVQVTAPGEITVELPGGGYVQGQVVDREGHAISSFSLSAGPMTFMAGGPAAQSFDSGGGQFRLGPLAPGRTSLWAAAEGYQPGEVPNLDIRPGETVSGVVVKLAASTYLSGRVTDATTGRPVTGALVLPAEWRAAALAEVVGGYTDEQGRYRLTALPGARTSIKVSAEGYRPLLVGGVEGGADGEAVRDFSVTPQASDARPATELTGIGAVLRPARGGVRLAQVLPGGPADEVLRSGDVVVTVDGRSVGSDVSLAAQAIRGEIGTDVVLGVQRGGRGPVQRVVVRRDRVTMPDPHAPRN